MRNNYKRTIPTFVGGLIAFCGLTAFAGVNFIKDTEVNVEPLSDEFRLYGSNCGQLTRFEEQYTWNKCLKLDITAFSKDNKGRPYLKTGIAMGGTAKQPGIAVKPGGKYRYSFELKGDVPRVVAVFQCYDAKGKMRQEFSDVREIVPQAEWTQYRGTLKVPDDVVRVALAVDLWHSEDYGKMPYKVGQGVFVDRIVFESAESGKEQWPTRVAVVTEKGAALDAFRLMGTAETIAAPLTEGVVRADEKGLNFSLTMRETKSAKPSNPAKPSSVWDDDHVELMFSRDAKLAPIGHLAVGAGGACWMRGENPDYASWRATVTKTGDDWTATVFVTWSLVGFKEKPAAGEPIYFNLARERLLGDWRDPKTPVGTRKSGWQAVESTTWTFVRDGFDRRDQWGVLFIGSMAPYVDRVKAALTEPEVAAKATALPTEDPTADFLLLTSLAEANRIAKLSKEKFVVAQVPYTIDPTVPYLPDELMEPQAVFRVKGAINERTALPIALANMTEGFEEYRLHFQKGWEKPTAADEINRPTYGFRSAAGDEIGMEKLVMRRGVKYRDSDAAGHGARYDILAKMNGVSTLPVPPKEAGLAWVEIDLRGVKPGLYKSTLVVTPLASGRMVKQGYKGSKYVIDDGSKEIPVEIEVLPFAIPDDLRLGLNGYFRALSDRTAKSYTHYDGMAFQVTPWFFDAKFDAEGNLIEKKPRNVLKPQIAFIRRNAKKIGKLPRVMIAYGAMSVFENFHIKKHNPHITLYSPEFWRAYRAWIQYIHETMISEGLPDYTIEVYDEPGKVPLEIFIKSLSEAHAAVPGVKLTITSGVPHYFQQGGKDHVDDWVFYSGSPKNILAWAKPWIAEKPGRTTTVYSCGETMRSSLHRYYRILAWQTMLIGADYVSLYQYTEQAPGLDIRCSPRGGVVYDTGDDVEPSIRLEALYRGMQDVNYLRYLRSLATDDSTDAKEARAFIDKAVNEVVYAAPQDPQRAEEMREQTVVRILKLLKAR